MFQTTLAFGTVESLEVANTLTYGGVEAGQYPLDIYTRWFRDFLTFVVPFGCVSYFPVAAVLGHAKRTGAPDWLLPLTPVVGFLFLAGSLWVWRFGVRGTSPLVASDLEALTPNVTGFAFQQGKRWATEVA